MKIPPALIGAAAPLLANAYSHDQLDALFMASGFPGDPPVGSKPHKCMSWLRRANAESLDPLAMFGALIAEWMDTPDAPDYPWVEAKPDKREPILKALALEGLSYQRGGIILGAALVGPSRSLAERLPKEGIPALETEFNRAYAQVESDPPAAITAACAILEAVCKTYLLSEGHDLPTKQVLSTLWSATSGHLGLAPKDIVGDDLRQILTGLSSIAVGVAALRTHKGSAHGHADEVPSGPLKVYRVLPRHARLAVHASHTMALFVLETWEARRQASTANLARQ